MARLLIAEDNKNVAELYREEFESEGFAVEVVDNGASAIERAREWQPHIVVLDIGLPEISGLEALSDLSSGGRPVIVNTAYPLFRKDFRAYQAKAWVAKSSNTEQLLEVVRQTLDGMKIIDE
jgi:CheY-like chemotaxis protein